MVVQDSAHAAEGTPFAGSDKGAERAATLLRTLLPKGRFARGAAVLVSGTAAGQSVVILSSPVLTRLYTPEEFGTLAVYSAALATIVLVASGRYELAIPLARAGGAAANLMALSLLVLLATTLLTTLGVSVFGEHLIALTNTPALGPFVWILPLGVLLGGANKVFTYWALRKEAFRRIASTRFQHGTGMVVSQVALGYAGAGAAGLIVGHVIGYAAGLRNLLQFTLRSDPGALREIVVLRIRRGAWRYRNFPLFSTWSDVANVAGTQLPLILFASLFSPVVAGLYMLAHRVANAPAALVSEAIGKAFMANSVEARRTSTLPELSLGVFGLLLRIGLVPLVLIGVVAPDFFALLFGPEWGEAGRYLQWILPWIAAVFVFVPLMTLLAVLERQRVDLAFQAILFVTRVGALVAGAALAGATTAVALYAGSASAVYLGFGVWTLRAAGVRLRRILGNLGKEIAVAAMAGAALFVLRLQLVTTPLSLRHPSTLLLLGSAVFLGALGLLRVRPALARLAKLESS